MAYSADRKPLELTALTSLASDDTIIVGDTSDVSEVAKSITKANLVTDLSSDFATAVQGALADTATQPGDALTTLSGDLPFTQIEQIATNRILGRSTAGTGDVEALADGAVRDIIGLATTDSPQFAGVNVGHATDTTITRVSAGVIAVEGTNVQLEPTEGGFVDGDKTKLDAVPAGATILVDGDKTGLDAGVVSGTAGTAGNLVEWDGNGDAIDSGIDATNVISSSDTATTSAVGVVELSTDAEAVTGSSDTVVTTPGNLTARLAAPGAIGGTTPVTSLTYDAGIGTVSALGNLGATEVIDWSTASHFTGTLDSNITITHSNETAGQKITLAFIYDGTAQRTITWTDVDKWATGTAPDAPSAAGEELVVTLIRLGTTVYGSYETFS